MNLVSPKSYTIRVSQYSQTIKVYPYNKRRFVISSETISDYLKDVLGKGLPDDIFSTNVSVGGAGAKITIGFPQFSFNFTNQWKEYNGTNTAQYGHTVTWTFDAYAKANPLLAINGKVSLLNLPQLRVIKTARDTIKNNKTIKKYLTKFDFDVYIKADAEVGLNMDFHRLANRNYDVGGSGDGKVKLGVDAEVDIKTKTVTNKIWTYEFSIGASAGFQYGGGGGITVTNTPFSDKTGIGIHSKIDTLPLQTTGKFYFELDSSALPDPIRVAPKVPTTMWISNKNLVNKKLYFKKF